eukprot:11972532-Karenia_brevis.AAC.1
MQMNETLVRDADCYLAPFNRNVAQYLSLRGSHLNQAMRAVDSGCKHPCADYTILGKLSTAKIRELSPEFADAINN